MCDGFELGQLFRNSTRTFQGRMFNQDGSSQHVILQWQFAAANVGQAESGSFVNWLDGMSQLQHPHVLPLVGACAEPPATVVPFMPVCKLLIPSMLSSLFISTLLVIKMYPQTTTLLDYRACQLFVGSILAALQLNALHHPCASARSAFKDNCELCAEQGGSRRLQLGCDNHEVIWVMPNCSPFCSSAIPTLCLYCHLMVIHYSRHVRSWQSQVGSLVVATATHVLVMLNGDLICNLCGAHDVRAYTVFVTTHHVAHHM